MPLSAARAVGLRLRSTAHLSARCFSSRAVLCHVRKLVLPFGRITWLFVNYGSLAVDIFFCLSGFIFFQLYRVAIETNRVTAREFAVLRFSRLYPLHLVTLVIATVLMEIYRHNYGASFAGLPTDPLLFTLQLFFASDWWPSPKDFDVPVWSVSIEVLLYTVFFIAAKKLVMRVQTIVAASLMGFALFVVHQDLGRGVASFFIGGLASYLVNGIFARNVSRSLGIFADCFSLLSRLKAQKQLIGRWRQQSGEA